MDADLSLEVTAPFLGGGQGGICRGHVLVTGTPDPPPMEFNFVSQGGMVKIPLINW